MDSEIVKKAKAFEDEGKSKLAAGLYMECLQSFQDTKRGNTEVIGLCLRRLGQICYNNEKYEAALEFRNAERLLYESQLIAVVGADKDSLGTFPAQHTEADEHDRLAKLFF